MTHQIIFNIALLALCSFGYYYAFRIQKQQQYSIALAIIVLLGALLRIYLSADMFLHPWDERYHALVAKNMLSDPLVPMLYQNTVIPLDYRDWCANEIWLHKQPVPLWLMSAGIAVFGTWEPAVRFSSVLLSTIAIVVIYGLGKELFGKPVGFFAAFLLSIHGLTIEITSGRVATDHIDLCFMVFVLISMYYAVKDYRNSGYLFKILCGLFLGLAIMSKWLPALIVYGVWAVLNIRRISFGRFIAGSSIILGFAAILVLPWQIYIYTNWPAEAAWEARFNMLHITEVLDNNSGHWYYHFAKMGMLYGELSILALIWLAYKLLKPHRWRVHLAVFLWFLIPFVFFSIPKTKMQAYTLFAAPAIFISAGLFYTYLKQFIQHKKLKIPAILIMILLIMLPVRYSIERLKIFEEYDRFPQWSKDIRQLKDHLKKETAPIVVFGAPNPVETMFHIDCMAYDFKVDSSKLNSLQQQGYRVVLWEEVIQP